MVQVFSLLAVEFLAFIGIIFARPFEGQRLNVIVVYILGFCKVATVALSAAFDTRWSIPRIPATVIGIIIIVIQGVLTIIVMIAVVVGAVSSYMSVMRNRETMKPKKWIPTRDKYFKHMDFKEQDIPKPPPPKPELEPPRGPYFSVNSVKRVAKVEDEDAEVRWLAAYMTGVLLTIHSSKMKFGVSAMECPKRHCQMEMVLATFTIAARRAVSGLRCPIHPCHMGLECIGRVGAHMTLASITHRADDGHPAMAGARPLMLLTVL